MHASIEVWESKGPIIEGELAKCQEFGNKIAKQVENLMVP